MTIRRKWSGYGKGNTNLSPSPYPSPQGEGTRGDPTASGWGIKMIIKKNLQTEFKKSQIGLKDKNNREYIDFIHLIDLSPVHLRPCQPCFGPFMTSLFDNLFFGWLIKTVIF
jgi:hypothetical protein